MASPVPQKDDVERWTVEQVAAWLRQMELTDCCESFLRRGIDGRSLMELTEDGLIFWCRDVSIRNRKEIMKLIRQIENQHLIATGRLQPPNHVVPPRRPPPGPPQHVQNPPDVSKEADDDDDDELETDNIDDDDFSSDEFDDDVEAEPMNFQHDEGPSAYTDKSTDSVVEDEYMVPLPATTQTFPNSSPMTLRKPTGIGGNAFNAGNRPAFSPEKRPPMPLPSGSVNPVPPSQNSSQRLGGQIGAPKLPPGRNQPLIPNSGTESPPRHPPPLIPGSSVQSPGPPIAFRQHGSKPNFGGSNVKNPPREWPPKKHTESPSPQNSNPPESNADGGGPSAKLGFTSQHRPTSLSNSGGPLPSKKGNHFASELQHKLNAPALPKFPPSGEGDNEYEVVEQPSGTFTRSENRANSPGLPSPNQDPPPLPQRNHDGTRPAPNLQQSSVGSNAVHNRQLPSPFKTPVNPAPFRQPTSRPSSTSGPSNINQIRGPVPSNFNLNRGSAPTNFNQIRPVFQPPLPVSNNSQGKSLIHPPVPTSQDRPQKSGFGGPNVNQNKSPLQIPPGPSNSTPPALPLTPIPNHLQASASPKVNSPPLERAPALPASATALKNQGGGGMKLHSERVAIGNGESVELKPVYRSLLDRPFFHVISRIKSKQLLENAADGVYLIRPSTRSSDPLTLCLRYSARTYNINIRQRRDGLYALGKEKVSEMTFNTVDEIVSTYTNEPIKLQSGDRVRLTSSPSKTDHIYVKMPVQR